MPTSIIILILIAAIAALSFLLFKKTNEVKKFKGLLTKMKKAFSYLDDQAKMIVKTDVEINRAQEFLDKRLSALDTLQKTSRLISTTLDENEIFHRLKQALTTDLGFEKSLIFILDDKKNCNARITSGFSEEEIFYITGRLEKENDLLNALKEGNAFSSPRSPFSIKEKILQIFQIEHFVLSPVLAQSGMIGAVFVGNKSNIALSDGDEEFISILANQIGQALENARLFDQVYSSSQLLELKVQERTRQLESALT
ncbi:MAG: GAF domain-containing protein, partial [Candidatus Omnitrophica bacterium]|nr:GAF domain-containing protein [Candidatus Omnitrophota bacterium]